MKPNEIFEILKAQFADDIIELHDKHAGDPFISVKPEKIYEISKFVRDAEGLRFDYMSCLSGVDLKENLGVVYHLWSYELKHSLVLKTEVSKESPKLRSVELIWRAADWHERETYDLLGIEFEGHHNLIRILCPYDWEGFPLRKDYKTPEEYHGVKIPY